MGRVLVIAHPECTYLTTSANKWLRDQPPRKTGVLVGTMCLLPRLTGRATRRFLTCIDFESLFGD